MAIYRVFDTFREAERYAQTRRAGANIQTTEDGKFRVETASEEMNARCTADVRNPRDRYQVACGEPAVCDECYSCAVHCHVWTTDEYLKAYQDDAVLEQIEEGKRG